MSASRALKELKGGRACFPALCRTSKLCPQHPCSNREPLHGTSGYSLGWMCGLGHRAGTPRDFTLEKNSFPCTFVLDTPSSFQTRQGYNPGHIFFTTFQAILPISLQSWLERIPKVHTVSMNDVDDHSMNDVSIIQLAHHGCGRAFLCPVTFL